MTIRNFIFDLDGTLIDSAQLTGLIIDEMLAARGIADRADRALIRQMDAIGGEAMIAVVMGRYTTDPAADLAEFRTRHRIADTPADLAFPDVADCLAELVEAGVKLAICSNKPQYLCEKILTDLRLDRHFDIIVGSEAGRRRKPAPDAANLVLEQLGAEPGTTFYCGDSLVDLETAEAAGLPMILVAWGYGTAEVLARSPRIITVASMDELGAMVGRGNHQLLAF
jgi:phosphoglycolate phosphatase